MVAITSALSMTALLATTALAIDLGSVYSERGVLQHVADSAALAGATAYNDTSSTTAVTATIKDLVQANGFATTVIQTSGTGYLSQSPQNSSTAAVQVTLQASSPTHLIEAVSAITGVNITVSSLVELAGSTPVCVLALAQITVGTSTNLNGCSMAADSNNSNAVQVNGHDTLTANTVAAVGDVQNNGTINATIKDSVPTVADPFAADQSEAANCFTNCAQPPQNATSLMPGCWQDPIVKGTLTLVPGTYYFTSLTESPGASLVATQGTTIIVRDCFTPSGSISVTAPTSENYAGLAIYSVNGDINMNSYR